MKIFIALILTALCFLPAFAQTQEAQIVVTQAFLRKSPESNSEKVRTLQKGDKIRLENAADENGWYLASVSGGKVKGWIRKEFIRVSAAVAETPKQTRQNQTPKPPQQTQQNQPSQNQPSATQTRPKIVSIPAPKPTPSAAAIASSTPSSATPTAEQSVTPSPSPTPDNEPIEDNEVLRIETAEVNMTVRVVDQNNRPVSNLNQADFKIYEDGVLQPITSIATAEVPIINALVIDNSRSLRSQLQKVIEAGKIIIGTNRPDDQSTVVRFVSADKIETMQGFTPNKAALNNALDNLFVEGGQTAIVDAVYETAKNVNQYQKAGKNEDAKIRSLILVTDGDDRGSRYKEQQLIELLRQSEVQIYAIGFVDALSKVADANGINRQEKAKSFLTRLAQETGGKVYFPASLEELSQIASDISRELRTQYLISYAPTNEARDNNFRKIKVEVSEGANKEKRTAISRTGRSAQPQ
jgi:Ca-activated chloride channel family protein